MMNAPLALKSTNQDPAKPYLHASAVRYGSKDQKKIKSITNNLTGYLHCIGGTNKDSQTEDTLLQKVIIYLPENLKQICQLE